MKTAKEKGVEILLPTDSVVAKEFKNDTDFKVVDENGIEEGWMALDIGPGTIRLYADPCLERPHGSF